MMLVSLLPLLKVILFVVFYKHIQYPINHAPLTAKLDFEIQISSVW